MAEKEKWYIATLVAPDGSTVKRVIRMELKTGDWVEDLETGETMMVLSIEPYPG